MSPIILALIIVLGIGFYLAIYVIVTIKLLKIAENTTERNEREQWRNERNMK